MKGYGSDLLRAHVTERVEKPVWKPLSVVPREEERNEKNRKEITFDFVGDALDDLRLIVLLLGLSQIFLARFLLLVLGNFHKLLVCLLLDLIRLDWTRPG